MLQVCADAGTHGRLDMAARTIPNTALRMVVLLSGEGVEYAPSLYRVHAAPQRATCPPRRPPIGDPRREGDTAAPGPARPGREALRTGAASPGSWRPSASRRTAHVAA